MERVHRLVVIGASAGGIEALRLIVRALPTEFSAAICVVVHTSPQSPGVIGAILDRAGPLRAVQADTGMRLEPGQIYAAPPDHHLLVEPGRMRLGRGPRENRFRPAIDPLFRSAAQVYGPAAIGVVLTGNLDDGTAGLYAIKQMGGLTLVQDPRDAMYPAMPRSALEHVRPDYCLPLPEIAPRLVELVGTPVYASARSEPPALLGLEVEVAREEDAMAAVLEQFDGTSPYACPECHGVMWQKDERGHRRFRCHTGHAYSREALLASMREAVEDSIWGTLRAMNETRALADHLATHSADTARAQALKAEADEVGRKITVLRELLSVQEDATPTEPRR